jgi:hypothetical protein
MTVHRFHSLRTLGAVTVACLAAAGLVAIGAGPAAATTETTSQPTSWAYVDSATPSSSFVNQPGDLPIGAFTSADGRTHVARAFITFDVSAFASSDVLAAMFTTDETSVADCTKSRETEVFRTDSAAKPTWLKQPAELSELPAPEANSNCPAAPLTWDASQAVRDAAAAKAKTVTLELRLPAADENDIDLGRRYSTAASLTVQDNQLPEQPGSLNVNQQPCVKKPIPLNTTQVFLFGTSNDPDDQFFQLTTTYTYWPVDQPDNTHTAVSTNGGSVDLDPTTLVDGTTYVWQAQVSDGTDVGPVSKTCEFSIDLTAPALAPTVSSAGYPANAKPNTHGGVGIPGTFTVKATGDPDVVGFDYSTLVTDQTFVAANHAGGSAKIQLTPSQSGSNDLTVFAVDAAGNLSPSTDYVFDVADNSPDVTCTPASAFIGVSRQCTFTPKATTAKGALPVVEYDYTDFRTEFSVPAGPDGSATVTVLPMESISGNFSIAASAKLSNGQLTGDTQVPFNVDLGFPQVTPQESTVLVNQPVTLSVHAVLPGSVTVTYSDQFGDQGTVPVDVDGNATITVTPHHSTFNFNGPITDFFVHSTTADGQDSGTGGAAITVLTNGPAVTSTDYPQNQFAGAIGQPGTFTFTSPVPGVRSFTYTLDDGGPITVPASTDGTASVQATPTDTVNTLSVTSTLADGGTSEAVTYTFEANEDVSAAGAVDSPAQPRLHVR